MIALDDAPLAPPRFQRNEGAIRLVFRRDGVRTYPATSFQRGTMKLRFPNSPQPLVPETVLVNISGGLTGGDQVSLDVALERGAEAVIASQACEKIYRSPGGAAHIRAAITLCEGASLHWLPQPTILFDGARLARATSIEMAPDARLLSVEANIFGRTAMQEDVLTGALADRTHITRGGVRVHADIFSLDGEIAARLDRPAILGGARAMATIRYVAPDAPAHLEPVRARLAALACEGGVSAWDGMLIVRLVAPDGYRLTGYLTDLLEHVRGRRLPRCWSL